MINISTHLLERRAGRQAKGKDTKEWPEPDEGEKIICDNRRESAVKYVLLVPEAQYSALVTQY